MIQTSFYPIYECLLQKYFHMKIKVTREPHIIVSMIKYFKFIIPVEH
jgi:hypothetical protein